MRQNEKDQPVNPTPNDVPNEGGGNSVPKDPNK